MSNDQDNRRIAPISTFQNYYKLIYGAEKFLNNNTNLLHYVFPSKN